MINPEDSKVGSSAPERTVSQQDEGHPGGQDATAPALLSSNSSNPSNGVHLNGSGNGNMGNGLSVKSSSSSSNNGSNGYSTNGTISTNGGHAQNVLDNSVAAGGFKVAVSIENADKMAGAYIRTRHNNLRCFPQCGKVHKTKSFCGTPLYVRIKRLEGSLPLQVKELQVFAEFRNVRKSPAFSISAHCPSRTIDQGSFIPGHLSGTTDDIQFTINPPRKWRYRARIAQVLDMHVFTVYVVARETIVAVKDSPQFQVIPIWKADESMLKPGEDEDGVEDDEVSQDEESDAASVAQKTRSSAPPSPGKRMRIDDETASESLSRRSSTDTVLRRDSSVGSGHDLQDTLKSSIPSFPNFGNLQPLHANFGGLSRMPPYSPMNQMYQNSGSFFPSFPFTASPHFQGQMSSNAFNFAGLAQGALTPPPSWQSMAAPALPTLRQSDATSNISLCPLPATENGASPLQNSFLTSLLNKAYYGQPGLGFPTVPNMQSSPALVHSTLGSDKLPMMTPTQGPMDSGSLAPQMTSASTMNSQPPFPSSLTGQTMHLTSGKNAKEKHQD